MIEKIKPPSEGGNSERPQVWKSPLSQLANTGGRKTLLAKNIQQDTLVVIKLLACDRNFN